MANEKEEILKQEIADLEEQTKILAEKLERLVGVDCSFGACVFDPEMEEAEAKIAEVQKRKKSLQDLLDHLESCQ